MWKFLGKYTMASLTQEVRNTSNIFYYVKEAFK